MDNKIENTLKAFDGMARAKAPEDFEEKLFKRLRFVPGWIRWFQYSAAALLILGVINIVTVFSMSEEDNTTDNAEYLEDNLLTDTSYPLLTITEE